VNCWSTKNQFWVNLHCFCVHHVCFSHFFLSFHLTGSSTACVLILNRENSTVYTANIGDSGFILVRSGEIVHRSSEQQHYFNTPFQLSLPPPGHGDNVLSDRPESADQLSFPVKNGDVILVATDGVFDNVPENLLLNTLMEVRCRCNKY
jgi:protein phosphatase PTC7